MLKKWRNVLKNKIDIDRIKQEKIEKNTYHKNYLPINSFKGKLLELIRENRVVVISGNTECEKLHKFPNLYMNQMPKTIF